MKPHEYKKGEGGIVYGPNKDLKGEYHDASSNPEVVAPLNKLRDFFKELEDDNPGVDFTKPIDLNSIAIRRRNGNKD